MPQNKETRVSKKSTFEEWRQSTNQVSFDVGPIESNDDLTADSLDKETRLTDQAKTVSVISGAASSTNIDVGTSAGWIGYNAFHSVGSNNTKGSTAHTNRNYEVVASEIVDQKFSVAANGNVTLAPNTKIWADDSIDDARNGDDGGMFLEANTYLENITLRGKTVTFSGTVDSTDLHSRYTVTAFIKSIDSANNYNLLDEVTAVVTSGSFSISLDIEEGSNILPQAGFLVSGVNANAATTAIADTSIVIESLALAISAGASELITDAEEFVRDQSNGSNDVGIRIDLAPDKKIDMTAGHIIFKDNAGEPTDFIAGNSIEQYTGNSSSGVREFAANIVSVVKSGSNITKLLITNAVGVFNPGLIIGSADNYSTVAQQIAADKVVRQVTGLLDHGYVRVYKTNSGTTTKLEQGVGIANGFHLPRATFALPINSTATNTLPATYLEGERVYQTANNAVESASNVATFSAKILIATTTANKYGLGSAGGLILYDTDGTFEPGKNIKGTIDQNAVIAASRYTATHNDCVIDQTFSSIIRLNTPAVTGDSFSVEFASAVDAIVEVQDDIGKIEDIATNTVQAKFGASAGQKSLATSDIVTTLNTLQDMIGNSVLPTIANNTHLVPANVTTISDLAKNIVTFIGDTDLSDAALGATANASSTLTDAITAIKTFIGNTDISDITTGENITTTIAQLHDEVGDVTTLDAIGTATAGGFDTEVLTTALIELRTLVCPGDIDDAQTALSANAEDAANFAATTNTDGIVEIQKIIGNRTGLDQNTLGDVTDTPTNIVTAINNIKAYIGTTVGISNIKTGTDDDTITGAVKQLHDEIGEQALTAGTNYNTNVGTLSHAIHGIQAMLGDVDVSGIGGADNISSAVNKIHAELGDADSLNANPVTALNAGTTDGTGGFRNTTGASDATVVSALTELRQALLGDGINLAVVGSAARTDTTISATIALAKADLANLNGYSKTNIIDSILEIQELLGDITSLTSATNDFNTANVVASLVELKTALVGADDLTDTIATLNTVDGGGTDFNTGNVVDAIREIQTDIGTLSSLASTPFAVDGNIEGSYTNTTFKDIIASTNEYIGAANIAPISTANNTITGALVQLHDELGSISNFKLGSTANRSKTYASGGADGATTVTVNNVAGLVEGMSVTGTNIPAGTRIQSISNNTITLTQAISGGATSGSLVFRTEDVQAAVLANATNIGETDQLDDEVGYTKQIIAPAIKEIQQLIGDIQDNNEAPILNSANTRITRDTDAAVNASATTIPMADTTGIKVGMKVKNTESGRTGSIAAGTLVTTVNVGVSIVVDTDVVSTINSGDTLQFDSPTVVNAVRTIDARIGQQVTPANMGTAATTLVTAIKEITDEIGNVTAGNLGTTSSTITTAIKEVVDGTGAATVTVKTIASQQPTGKLDKVSATAQTILGDINFNSPGSGSTNTTTLTFGANTVLDVSAGTLKMSSDAAGVFNVSSAFINLQPSANTGAGLQVDRSVITGATIETDEDAIIQWIESSVNNNDPASAHNTSDIAWHVKGLTSATSPADYNKPNVDFQNAYRLFSIGTTNVANSMSNVTVTWDSTNHNFDVSLNDTTTDMTSGSDAGNATYGTTAKIPQITVDRQGRISAMDEVDMANFLGTFNVLGDSGTQQAVVQGDNVKFAGTSGEIETAVNLVSGTKTVTIGLPDNVDVDGTFGAAGNVNLVSGNAASSTITLGGSNTTTTVAGTLNIPGILNVTGTNNSVTVSNTTITGDALVLRTEDDSVPANTDTPKFVINRGFSAIKNTTQLVAGKRYKIVSGTGFTSLGADNNLANTVFTATGAGSSNTGTAKLQVDEAAIVWQEEYDQFLLTRGGDFGGVSTNTQQGAIIAQGDTIGSATKFTPATNSDNEDKQVLFADVTGSTSQLQRNTGLLFNPSTNKLTLSSGQLDLGYFKHLNNKSHIHSNTNLLPLEISCGGASDSQVLKVGVGDTEATFNYIEDTSSEGKNVFGKYRFLLNGNHADADEITDRIGLEIDQDKITARGLEVNTNGVDVTGDSDLKGDLNHIGLFTQERHDVDSSTVLGHESNNRIIGAHFQSKVTTSGNKSILQIEDRRSTADTDGSEVYSTATKGIQHIIDSTYMSFLDFQATNQNNHQAILGGISHGTRKTYISGNGTTSTKIYNNTDDASASALVFETKADGVDITGTVTASAIDASGTAVHDLQRSHSITDAAVAVMDIKAKSTGDMAAGFGSATRFIIEDTANTENVVAEIAARRESSDTTAALTFTTGGDESVRIDSSGNVGIGVTPESFFSGYVAQQIGNCGFLTSGTADSHFDVNANVFTHSDGVFKYKNDGEATMLRQNNGQFEFFVFPSGVADAQAYHTTAMTIDNSGSVGIGTDSPSYKLHVRSADANDDVAYVHHDNASQTSGTVLKVRSDAGSGTGYSLLDVENNSGSALYVRGDGNVGIGTASPNSLLHLKSASDVKLTLETDEDSDCWINFSGATSEASIGYEPTDNALVFANAGDGLTSNERMRIDSSGNVLVGKTSSSGNTVGVELRPNGGIFGTKDGGYVARFNRKTSYIDGVSQDDGDGEIVDFRKDGTTVGSIGTASGSMYIEGNPSTGKTGLTFFGSSIEPRDEGSASDGAVDLGASGSKFKDLYLSGIAFAGEDFKTTTAGKGFYAFGGGADYLAMIHDGSGGHIISSDKLEIETPIFEVRATVSASELMIQATANGAVTLYNDNLQKLVTTVTGVRIGRDADDVAIANYVDGTRFNPSNLEVNQISFDSGLNDNDTAHIKYVSTVAGAKNRSALDIKITDDVDDDVAKADKIRMRMASGSVNSGNEYSLVEISGKANGSTRMDLTQSPGTTSEVIADTFTGALSGNASTATDLASGSTLTVAKGGTGTTAFTDKSVIISQDTNSTDTLAAVPLSAVGQLLIGGTLGPAAATLTAGAGIDITNANNSITIKAETASASNQGVAQFSTDNFLVSSGNVTIKTQGVATAELVNNAVTFAKMQNIATDTIMGRTDVNTGAAKALSAAEARGVLNVADGADNYGSWKLKGGTTDTVGTDIGTAETVSFLGTNATSVSRSDNIITITSNNTTYSAQGGISSTDLGGIYLNGTKFNLGSDIRPNTTQIIGTSEGTYTEYSAGGTISMYLEGSSDQAAYMRTWEDWSTAMQDVAPPHQTVNHLGVIVLGKVIVGNLTPTRSDELTTKFYVDGKHPKMAACTHTGSESLDLKNCTVSKTATGKYTVTLSTDKGVGSFPHVVASLQNDYSTGSLGGNNTANPALYSITARRNGTSRTQFLIEIVKLTSVDVYGGGDDNNSVSNYYRYNVDLPWSCLIYNGEGD